MPSIPPDSDSRYQVFFEKMKHWFVIRLATASHYSCSPSPLSNCPLGMKWNAWRIPQSGWLTLTSILYLFSGECSSTSQRCTTLCWLTLTVFIAARCSWNVFEATGAQLGPNGYPMALPTGADGVCTVRTAALISRRVALRCVGFFCRWSADVFRGRYIIISTCAGVVCSRRRIDNGCAASRFLSPRSTLPSNAVARWLADVVVKRSRSGAFQEPASISQISNSHISDRCPFSIGRGFSCFGWSSACA